MTLDGVKCVSWRIILLPELLVRVSREILWISCLYTFSLPPWLPASTYPRNALLAFLISSASLRATVGCFGPNWLEDVHVDRHWGTVGSNCPTVCIWMSLCPGKQWYKTSKVSHAGQCFRWRSMYGIRKSRTQPYKFHSWWCRELGICVLLRAPQNGAAKESVMCVRMCKLRLPLLGRESYIAGFVASELEYKRVQNDCSFMP